MSDNSDDVPESETTSKRMLNSGTRPTMAARRPSPRVRQILFMLTILVPTGAVADDTSIVAIVTSNNPSANLTIHELRLMYGLYRRTWEGGVRVVLVLPENGTPEMEFLATRVFRRSSESEVTRYFVQAVFQQRVVKAPPSLPSNSAIALVRIEEGAIALVEAGEGAEAALAEDVRVLLIGE